MKSFFKSITLALLIISVVSGCQPTPQTPQPTQTEIIIPDVSPTVQEATIQPTEEPERNSVILVGSAGLDSINEEDISKFLQDFANKEGLNFLQADDLSTEVMTTAQFIISYNAQDNILELARQNPSPIFVFISNVNLDLPANAYLIRVEPANRIFLAGYLSALVSNDWRVGGLLQAGQINNTPRWKIFENGTRYLCGRCVPVYAPVIPFPVTSEIPDNSDQENLIALFEELHANRLDTVYIPSDFLTDTNIVMIEQYGVNIISNFTNNAEIAPMIDIMINLNITNALSQIMEHSPDGSQQIFTPDLEIVDNSNLISPGKMEDLHELIQILEENWISPYSISDQS